MSRFSFSFLGRFVSITLIGMFSWGGWTPAASATGETCFATPDNGTTLYASVNAQAVRDAVNQAAVGGVVKVAGYCPGVQIQGDGRQTLLITKSLTLAGGYTHTNWNTYNPVGNPTILDAQGLGRVIAIPTATSVTLQGFTVTNGKQGGVHGGGIFAAGALTLTEMTVYSNTVDPNGVPSEDGIGGGVYVAGQSWIAQTLFDHNSARYGGGAYFDGPTSLINATFTANWAANYIDNTDLGAGGGAYFGAAALVSNTTFMNNETSDYGGGAAFKALAHVVNSRFEGNAVFSPHSYWGDGGGASFYGEAQVTNTVFLNNYADSIGGGASFVGPTTLQNTTFTQNFASRAGGASFQLQATLDRTRFVANTGGGVYFYNANARLTNVLLANNRGFPILITTNQLFTPTVEIIHTTIVSATPSTYPALVANYLSQSAVYITNTIIASHTVGLDVRGGIVHEDYNLFANVTMPYTGSVINGGHSFTGTVGFANPIGGDYRLQRGSAALDTGVNAGITRDFEGELRPARMGYDIGYDECWLICDYGYAYYLPWTTR